MIYNIYLLIVGRAVSRYTQLCSTQME